MTICCCTRISHSSCISVAEWTRVSQGYSVSSVRVTAAPGGIVTLNSEPPPLLPAPSASSRGSPGHLPCHPAEDCLANTFGQIFGDCRSIPKDPKGGTDWGGSERLPRGRRQHSLMVIPHKVTIDFGGFLNPCAASSPAGAQRIMGRHVLDVASTGAKTFP